MTDLSKILYYQNFTGKSGRLKDLPGFGACDNGTIETGNGYGDNSEHAHTWIAKGDDGWSRWGFEFKNPALENCGVGDEIWWRVAMCWPTDFSFATDHGSLKTFRIGKVKDSNGDNRGYVDFQIKTDQDWRALVEYQSNDSWDYYDGGKVVKGKWQIFEVYVKLGVGPNGIMRIWRDGKLFGESRRGTIETATHVERLLWSTYWNGDAPKTQGMDIDEMAVAVKNSTRDDTAHMGTDDAGNYLIGTETAEGELPDVPDVPDRPGLPDLPDIKPGKSTARMVVTQTCVFVHTDLQVIVVPTTVNPED
jgi:hypothetical protein